ncbi:hypothetical protein BLNAU_3643 [Blattamonas nauphoetae]|uniref:Rho-GAP domain-containing protein n=1 Tax=Blattamonas nauphoetae TaxID=2049346 RepID=A0ABQ9YCY5_9EUKA|nr:hypothetical protein BLNAU_3643 [Blattamonas nauphoetae]
MLTPAISNSKKKESQKVEPKAAKGKVQQDSSELPPDTTNIVQITSPESLPPLYPKSFVFIVGFPSEQKVLSYLQQYCLSLGFHIDSIINIKPTLQPSQSFLSSLKTALLPTSYRSPPINPKTGQIEENSGDVENVLIGFDEVNQLTSSIAPSTGDLSSLQQEISAAESQYAHTLYFEIDSGELLPLPNVEVKTEEEDSADKNKKGAPPKGLDVANATQIYVPALPALPSNLIFDEEERSGLLTLTKKGPQLFDEINALLHKAALASAKAEEEKHKSEDDLTNFIKSEIENRKDFTTITLDLAPEPEDIKPEKPEKGKKGGKKDKPGPETSSELQNQTKSLDIQTLETTNIEFATFVPVYRNDDPSHKIKTRLDEQFRRAYQLSFEQRFAKRKTFFNIPTVHNEPSPEENQPTDDHQSRLPAALAFFSSTPTPILLYQSTPLPSPQQDVHFISKSASSIVQISKLFDQITTFLSSSPSSQQAFQSPKQLAISAQKPKSTPSLFIPTIFSPSNLPNSTTFMELLQKGLKGERSEPPQSSHSTVRSVKQNLGRRMTFTGTQITPQNHPVKQESSQLLAHALNHFLSNLPIPIEQSAPIWTKTKNFTHVLQMAQQTEPQPLRKQATIPTAEEVGMYYQLFCDQQALDIPSIPPSSPQGPLCTFATWPAGVSSQKPQLVNQTRTVIITQPYSSKNTPLHSASKGHQQKSSVSSLSTLLSFSQTSGFETLSTSIQNLISTLPATQHAPKKATKTNQVTQALALLPSMQRPSSTITSASPKSSTTPQQPNRIDTMQQFLHELLAQHAPGFLFNRLFDSIGINIHPLSLFSLSSLSWGHPLNPTQINKPISIQALSAGSPFPGPLTMLLSRQPSIQSFVKSIEKFLDTLNKTQQDFAYIAHSITSLVPTASLPSDFITLSDSHGDFDEGRDFFSYLKDDVVLDVLNDPETQDSLFFTLLCAAFSEMLASPATSSHQILSTTNVCQTPNLALQGTAPLTPSSPIREEQSKTVELSSQSVIAPSFIQTLHTNSLGSFSHTADLHIDSMSPVSPIVPLHLPNADQYASFGVGKKWDGKNATETVLDIPGVHVEQKRKKSVLNLLTADRLDSNSGTPKSQTDSQTPFLTPSGLQNHASTLQKIFDAEKDFKQLYERLEAHYTPPIVDPSEFTATQHFTPAEMTSLLNSALLFDPPLKTQYFPVEDAMLLAIGSVQKRDGTNENGQSITHFDRSYFSHLFGEAPTTKIEEEETVKGDWEKMINEDKTSGLHTEAVSPSLQTVVSGTESVDEETASPATPLIPSPPKPLLLAPLIVEEMNTWTSPLRSIQIHNSILRSGPRLSTHITAHHTRGHVFSFGRSAKFKMTESLEDFNDLSLFLEEAEAGTKKVKESFQVYCEGIREIAQSVPLADIPSALSAIQSALLKMVNPNQVSGTSTPVLKPDHQQGQGTDLVFRRRVKQNSLVPLPSPFHSIRFSHFSVLPSLLRGALNTFLQPAQITQGKVGVFTDTRAIKPVQPTAEAAISMETPSPVTFNQLQQTVVLSDIEKAFKQLMKTPLQLLYALKFHKTLKSTEPKREPEILLSSSQVELILQRYSSFSSLVPPGAVHPQAPPPSSGVPYVHTSPPVFNTSFNDSTTLSARFFETNPSSQNPFELTYSTRNGQIVTINSSDGTVRISSSVKSTPSEVTPRELERQVKEACRQQLRAEVEKAVEDGRKGLKDFRHGACVFGEQLETPPEPLDASVSPKKPKAKGKVDQAQEPEDVDVINPDTLTEQEREVFRRCFIQSLRPALLKLHPQSSSGHNTTRHVLPSNLSQICASPLSCVPLPMSKPVEKDRMIVGVGTTVVRYTSGGSSILLRNGDVSAFDGWSWCSTDSTGNRVCRPKFIFEIVPTEHVEEVVEKMDETKEDDKTESDNQTESPKPKLLKPEPLDLSPECHSLLSVCFRGCDFTQSQKIDSDTSVVFPTHFPSSLSLPPLNSVVSHSPHPAIPSQPPPSLTIRSDGVSIANHTTGERIVHHSDGTRVFHSFAPKDTFDVSNQPAKALLSIEHTNTPRVLIYLVKQSMSHALTGGQSEMKSESSLWFRDRVVVLLDDGTALEWGAADHKIFVSKPDCTHIHFSQTGCVSVFVDNASKHPPASITSFTSRPPHLLFNLFDGLVSVKPDKMSPPIITDKTGQNPSRSSCRRVFVCSQEGSANWAVARTMRSATISKRVPMVLNPSIFKKSKSKPGKGEMKQTLVATALNIPHFEDPDEPTMIEKKLKDAKMKYEQAEKEKKEEERRLKKAALKQSATRKAQAHNLPSLNNSPNVDESLENTKTFESDELLTDKGTPLPRASQNHRNLSRNRWFSKLTALHNHQLALSESNITDEPLSSTNGRIGFVLPRLFVVRSDGSGFELLSRKSVKRMNMPLSTLCRTDQNVFIPSSLTQIQSIITGNRKHSRTITQLQPLSTASSPSLTMIPGYGNPSVKAKEAISTILSNQTEKGPLTKEIPFPEERDPTQILSKSSGTSQHEINNSAESSLAIEETDAETVADTVVDDENEILKIIHSLITPLPALFGEPSPAHPLLLENTPNLNINPHLVTALANQNLVDADPSQTVAAPGTPSNVSNPNAELSRFANHVAVYNQTVSTLHPHAIISNGALPSDLLSTANPYRNPYAGILSHSSDVKKPCGYSDHLFTPLTITSPLSTSNTPLSSSSIFSHTLFTPCRCDTAASCTCHPTSTFPKQNVKTDKQMNVERPSRELRPSWTPYHPALQCYEPEALADRFACQATTELTDPTNRQSEDGDSFESLSEELSAIPAPKAKRVFVQQIVQHSPPSPVLLLILHEYANLISFILILQTHKHVARLYSSVLRVIQQEYQSLADKIQNMGEAIAYLRARNVLQNTYTSTFKLVSKELEAKAAEAKKAAKDKKKEEEQTVIETNHPVMTISELQNLTRNLPQLRNAANSIQHDSAFSEAFSEAFSCFPTLKKLNKMISTQISVQNAVFTGKWRDVLRSPKKIRELALVAPSQISQGTIQQSVADIREFRKSTILNLSNALHPDFHSQYNNALILASVSSALASIDNCNESFGSLAAFLNSPLSFGSQKWDTIFQVDKPAQKNNQLAIPPQNAPKARAASPIAMQKQLTQTVRVQVPKLKRIVEDSPVENSPSVAMSTKHKKSQSMEPSFHGSENVTERSRRESTEMPKRKEERELSPLLLQVQLEKIMNVVPSDAVSQSLLSTRRDSKKRDMARIRPPEMVKDDLAEPLMPHMTGGLSTRARKSLTPTLPTKRAPELTTRFTPLATKSPQPTVSQTQRTPTLSINPTSIDFGVMGAHHVCQASFTIKNTAATTQRFFIPPLASRPPLTSKTEVSAYTKDLPLSPFRIITSPQPLAPGMSVKVVIECDGSIAFDLLESNETTKELSPAPAGLTPRGKNMKEHHPLILKREDDSDGEGSLDVMQTLCIATSERDLMLPVHVRISLDGSEVDLHPGVRIRNKS